MNYNNPYYNPYQQYSYTQQQTQPTQQHNYYQPQQQTSYLPLTFVNGIEGAKAFIVGANQVIYLKDSDSNILYEKKADQQGKYTLNAYELKQVDINNIGKDTNCKAISTEGFIMKEDIKDFVKLSDLNALETLFESKIDKLSSRIEKLARNNYNKTSQKDSD